MRKRTIGVAVIGAVAVAALWGSGLLSQVARPTGASNNAGTRGAPISTGTAPQPSFAGARGPSSGGQPPSRTVIDAVAVTGTLPVARQSVGWIASPASLSLTSPQAGTVARLVVADGADVRTGDLIVQLDDRAAQLAVTRDNAQLQRDQASQAQADLNASRGLSLFNSGAGTKQVVDDTKTAAQVAAAAVAIDNATLTADQLTLSNLQIKAPFTGRLGAFQVSVGSVVQATTPMVTLTQMAPVQATFSLSQADLDLLKSAMNRGQVAVSVVSTTASSGPAVAGHVDFVDSTVDQASGTVKVKATLPNDGLALSPGESVTVTVDLGSTNPMVLVPAQAVQAAAQGFQVYVVKPDQTVDIRNVTLGPSAGGETGVTAGVKDGEHVVTEGQIRLTQGTKVAEVPAGGATAPPATNPGVAS
jgi:multidrug efflux system membrane fusion protein